MANAFAFSVVGFAMGKIVPAIGTALSQTEGVSAPYAYFIFFSMIPFYIIFSDAIEMLIRGAFFTVFVVIFAVLVVPDIWEAGAAAMALALDTLLAYLRLNHNDQV